MPGLSSLSRAAWAGRLALPGVALARALEELDGRPTAEPEPEARAHLARWLEARLAPLEPHVAVLEAARSLARPGAACVVATVRPGAFGGPLAVLATALRCVGVARALARREERPVVPVVWSDGDSCAQDAVQPACFLNHHADLQRVGLSGLGAGRRLNALGLDAERHSLPAVAALLRQLHGDHRQVDEALRMLLPRGGETFAGAFERALTELLGAHGVVVIDPESLREECAQALARAVAADAVAGLLEGARRIRAAGHDPGPEPAALELVRQLDAQRARPLRAGGEGFRFDDEPGSRTAAELAAEIVQEPARYGAGPALLPIVQELALPVAARVGGARALIDHARVQPLREALGLRAPDFVLRAPLTLVDADCARALERLGRTPLEVLTARAASEDAEADDEPAPVARVRAAAARAVAELLAARADLARLDPSFALQAKRAADALRGAVDKLAAKARNLNANRAGTERRHERRVRAALLPLGRAQEEVLGPFSFIARHGRGWIDALVGALDPFAAEHVVAHLATAPEPPGASASA